MKTKQLLSTLSILFFILLAFSVSFDFTNNTVELVCLLVGLFGMIGTAGASVFNPKIWNASHGPGGIKYKEAFKVLVVVIYSLIIINSILSVFHLIPSTFDVFKFSSWIVGYTAMISPNLAYIFQKELKKESMS